MEIGGKGTKEKRKGNRKKKKGGSEKKRKGKKTRKRERRRNSPDPPPSKNPTPQILETAVKTNPTAPALTPLSAALTGLLSLTAPQTPMVPCTSIMPGRKMASHAAVAPQRAVLVVVIHHFLLFPFPFSFPFSV